MKNRSADKSRSSAASRKTVSYILSFLLAVTIVVIGLLLNVKIAVSQSFVKGCISDEIVESARKTAYDVASDYTIPTGIDTSVLDDVITVDMVRGSLNEVIDTAYRDREASVSTDALSKALRPKVETFLKDNAVKVDDDTRDVMDAYVDDICKLYSSSVMITGINYLTSMRDLFNRYFLLCIAVSVCFVVALVIFILKLHKHVHRSMRFLVYALDGAAIMLFLAPFILFRSGAYRQFQISPEYLSLLISGYINKVLQNFFIEAAVCFVISLALIFVIYKKRNRLLKRRHFDS